MQEEINSKSNVSDSLKWIAQGPSRNVVKYPGYIINGCCYHTKDRDNSRISQNSGVTLVATTMQVTGYKDKNPIYVDMSFYGVIIEIWQLDYNAFRIPVFKCDWVDNKRGIKVDELGFTLVELGRIGHKSDSFILASQAKQVFYVEDQLDPKWSIVLEPPQRRYRDGGDELDDWFVERQNMTLLEGDITERSDDSISSHIRADCEGTWVDNTS